MSTEPGGHAALVPGLGEIRASYGLRLRMDVLKSVLKVARHLIERSATVIVLGWGAVMVVNGETELGVSWRFSADCAKSRDRGASCSTSTAAWPTPA